MRGWLISLLLLCSCDRVFGADPRQLFDAAIETGPWRQVAAGDSHTCAIQLDGSLWCWGTGDLGQLGLGETIEATTPTRVGTSVAWRSVAASGDTTCGVQTDDSLWCWGSNVSGNVGDGTLDSRATPVQISGVWRQVAVGVSHTCALDPGGQAACWGTNYNGESGTNLVTTILMAPTKVSSTLVFTSIALGQSHTCALAADRTAWCWGAAYSGQLGGGSAKQQLTPVQVSADEWLAITASGEHTCAILVDGHARCWGASQSGEIGDPGAGYQTLNPVPPYGDRDDYASIVAGTEHTCGTHTDGSLTCWGNNASGQIGGTLLIAYNPIPRLVDGGPRRWAQIAAGDRHTCGITPEGTLWCFGLVAFGQGRPQRNPTQVAGTWIRAAAGTTDTCAIDTAGALWCWGANSEGQLGNGTRVRELAPVQLPQTDWSSVSVGDSSTCGLRGNGELWCWGLNNFGLGDGSTSRFVPTHIGSLHFSQVELGGGHDCGLELGTGVAYCWGSNYYGEAGVGDVAPHDAPTPIPGFTWSSISPGAYAACGSTSTQVFCWGAEFWGALGDGAMALNPVASPISTTPVLGAGIVDLGGQHSTAVVGGQLWTWGTNTSGQIGNGTLAVQLTPAMVPGTWRTSSAGATHTCGIRSDGTLWCWGNNGRGQITGVLPIQPTPQQVGTDTSWDEVFAGGQHTCGLKTDHTLWCWGDNGDGQLGQGLGDFTGAPIQVPSP